MKPVSVILLVGGMILSGCSKKEADSAKPADATEAGNPITAPVDYLGAVSKAKKFSERTIETSSITRSIQLFYAQEDRFPTNLNELVTRHYLGGVPSAPAGMRWAYNPQNGEVKAVH